MSWEQIVQLIRDNNPQAPRRRLAGAVELRGELDWITLTALAPERERRYESVDALVADIRAYLHGDVVAAAPPGRWCRVRKWISRNRVAVVTSVAVIASLLVGIVATTGTMFWALREKDRALRAEVQAEQEPEPPKSNG